MGRLKVVRHSLLCWSLLWLFGTHCLTVSAQASEASLRVAFVYNFLKFIEWPAYPNSDFTLCALGAKGAAREALALLNNKSYQQQPIRLLYLDQTHDLTEFIHSCQLLYVPSGGVNLPLPPALPPGILLIVDEAEQEDDRVGIALMRTLDNRIEFFINDSALQHAGVKVSSQLLKLAKKRRGAGD